MYSCRQNGTISINYHSFPGICIGFITLNLLHQGDEDRYFSKSVEGIGKCEARQDLKGWDSRTTEARGPCHLALVSLSVAQHVWLVHSLRSWVSRLHADRWMESQRTSQWLNPSLESTQSGLYHGVRHECRNGQAAERRFRPTPGALPSRRAGACSGVDMLPESRQFHGWDP